MRLVKLWRRLLALSGLLSLFGVHPAPKPAAAAVYVPGPQNQWAPSPSCATFASNSRPPWRFKAACKTTAHGLVVAPERGSFKTEREATAAANAIYELTLASQGGVLRP